MDASEVFPTSLWDEFIEQAHHDNIVIHRLFLSVLTLFPFNHIFEKGLSTTVSTLKLLSRFDDSLHQRQANIIYISSAISEEIWIEIKRISKLGKLLYVWRCYRLSSLETWAFQSQSESNEVRKSVPTPELGIRRLPEFAGHLRAWRSCCWCYLVCLNAASQEGVHCYHHWQPPRYKPSRPRIVYSGRKKCPWTGL